MSGPRFVLCSRKTSSPVLTVSDEPTAEPGLYFVGGHVTSSHVFKNVTTLARVPSPKQPPPLPNLTKK